MDTALRSDYTSRSPTLLGIDLGTGSVKILIKGIDGSVRGQASADYAVSAPRPGWSESDPADWLRATVTAVHQAVGDSGADVTAIGFSGQMHGVVPVDSTGRALRRAILWSDSRAIPQLAFYRELPDPVRRRLANPFVPGMAGPILAWLAENEPEMYRRMRWALQPKDWLRAQLTGRFETEPSDASATLLYDLTADTWDHELMDSLRLDAAKMPRILAHSAEPAGELTTQAASLLVLRPGITVAAGAADTAAAALGSGLVQSDSVQLTIGSGIQIVRPLAALSQPLSSRPVTHTYRAATEKGWYTMGAVLNGGLTIGWALRVLGADWAELYATAAQPPRLEDPYFLPHLHGERTPYLDPGMRGAWTDLQPQHGRQELLRATLEGVAFAIREALQCVVTAQDHVTQLRLAGGGTTHTEWQRMLADILGYRLDAVEIHGASGIGATMLAAQAAELVDQSTTIAWIPATRRAAEPRHDHSDLYQQRHHAFIAKVRALNEGATPHTLGAR